MATETQTRTGPDPFRTEPDRGHARASFHVASSIVVREGGRRPGRAEHLQQQRALLAAAPDRHRRPGMWVVGVIKRETGPRKDLGAVADLAGPSS